MKTQKIRSSGRIVEKILGEVREDAGQWFAIHQRMALTGRPTFSLYYRGFRGAQIPLVIDEPLATVKRELGEFAKTNNLTSFVYIKELVEELQYSPRFTPPPPKPNTRLYQSRYLTACLTATGVRFTRKTTTGGGSMINAFHEVYEGAPEWNESFHFGWGEASYTMTPKEVAEACRKYPSDGNEQAYNRLFEAKDFTALTHVPYWGTVNCREDAPDRLKIVARLSQVWGKRDELAPEVREELDAMERAGEL